MYTSARLVFEVSLVILTIVSDQAVVLIDVVGELSERSCIVDKLEVAISAMVVSAASAEHGVSTLNSSTEKQNDKLVNLLHVPGDQKNVVD